MFGNNSSTPPPRMRYPPPPFFPIMPNMNPNIPAGWPPAPPRMPPHVPPAWSNPAASGMMQAAPVHLERSRVPFRFQPENGCRQQVKPQEELDREWLKNFLQRCHSSRLETGKNTDKISDAKHMHTQAYRLLKQLKEHSRGELALDELSISNIKKELDGILAVFSDEDYMTQLAAKLEKRRKKRTRMKSRKQEALRKIIARDIEVREEHVRIDKWLDERRKAEEDSKREKKVQKDLDEYLSDIRQKQHKAKKHLDLFDAVAKLRKARRAAAVRKGRSPPSEAHDDVFKSAHKSSCDKLREFITACRREETFMRKYRTDEHRAEEKKIRDTSRKHEERKVLEWKRERSNVLFGNEGNPEPSDPMWPVGEIQRQGAKNIVSLISVRAQWDCFISQAGSRIPTGWVEPCPPTNAEWSEYLAKS